MSTAGGARGAALVGYDGPVVTEADRAASAAVPRRVGEAVGLLELGRELQARGEFWPALASFTRVVREYADLALSEYARVGRALVLYEIGDRDESIAEMEDVDLHRAQGIPRDPRGAAGGEPVRHRDAAGPRLRQGHQCKHWPPSLVASPAILFSVSADFMSLNSGARSMGAY